MIFCQASFCKININELHIHSYLKFELIITRPPYFMLVQIAQKGKKMQIHKRNVFMMHNDVFMFFASENIIYFQQISTLLPSLEIRNIHQMCTLLRFASYRFIYQFHIQRVRLIIIFFKSGRLQMVNFLVKSPLSSFVLLNLPG